MSIAPPVTPDDSGRISLQYADRVALLERRATARCARVECATSSIAEAIERWEAEHPLKRSVLVVDDSATQALAIAALLRHLGCPVHVVMTAEYPSLDAAVAGYGAIVHRVGQWIDAAEVWRQLRCAVVILDIHLGNGVTGMDVLEKIGREPVAVLVSSCDPSARESVERVAVSVRAHGIVRSHTGGWLDQTVKKVADGLRIVSDS